MQRILEEDQCGVCTGLILNPTSRSCCKQTTCQVCAYRCAICPYCRSKDGVPIEDLPAAFRIHARYSPETILACKRELVGRYCLRDAQLAADLSEATIHRWYQKMVDESTSLLAPEPPKSEPDDRLLIQTDHGSILLRRIDDIYVIDTETAEMLRTDGAEEDSSQRIHPFSPNHRKTPCDSPRPSGIISY